MNENILILSAPLKERIWGGNYFKNVLKITNSDDLFGELWTCSGHKGDESIVLNGTFKGQKLSEVWNSNRNLFNDSKLNEFPILIKLIATSDKLSVQVHPNDEYAKVHENQFGKTEGWLILDAKDDSSIVVGHNARSKEELIEYVKADRFDELLKSVRVKPGNFYPIPAGTIHALGKNLVLLEIQQSSDVTYRFYDYHRKDKNGKERELHIEKAIDVTSYKPYQETIKNCFDNDVDVIWDNEFFKVTNLTVNSRSTVRNNNKYCIITPASGEVEVMGYKLGLGNSAIITSNVSSFDVTGNGRVLITYSKQ